MNALDDLREELGRKTIETREAVRARRAERGYVDYGIYPVCELEGKLHYHDVELEFVDREEFGADVAVKSPSLLKERGSRAYIETDVPALIAAVNDSELVRGGIVEKVESKGIYVNLKLADKYLFETLARVGQLGDQYGESDVHEGENAAVDYSSPNVAKHLHAGHIRSTIIGHVVSNIYEAVGYTAHRINHVNDWGGFGELIEAHKRWQGRMAEFASRNDYLYFLYLEFRKMETAAEASEEGKKIFEEFDARAKENFRALESGDAETVKLWREMVGWSFEEFNKFYDLLNIHQDYVLGESFYAKRAEELVERGLRSGAIEKDDGADIVPLGDGEKMVVKRSDGSTIYSTRDLAAIEHRVETFDPAALVYVVGQEQTEHFSKLFRAAKILGLFRGRKVALKHLPFGHYIGAETKKKLSSREGAENVINVIDAALKFFRAKYSSRTSEMMEDEKDTNARKLAIGSIAFNDVKKDRKFPVEFSSDISKVLEEFEESGGAYLMYASARARSILRKYDGPMPEVKDAFAGGLTPIEISLIKKINDFPRIVLRAAEFDNPAAVAGYLLELAREYNSYYESHPVLQGGELAFPHRLVITGAVAQVIDNGLRLLHAEGPERI
jgi:arginyl-tRNA synthetase